MARSFILSYFLPHLLQSFLKILYQKNNIFQIGFNTLFLNVLKHSNALKL